MERAKALDSPTATNSPNRGVSDELDRLVSGESISECVARFGVCQTDGVREYLALAVGAFLDRIDASEHNRDVITHAFEASCAANAALMHTNLNRGVVDPVPEGRAL